MSWLSDWRYRRADKRRQRSYQRGTRYRESSGCGDTEACEIGCLGAEACGECGDLFLLMPALLSLMGLLHVRPRGPWWSPRGWLLRLIASYQYTVSPRRDPVCNLTPTCSRYGKQAVEEQGVLRGLLAIRRRLLECSAAGRAARATTT